MTITDVVVKKIVLRLIQNQDYRVEIVSLIDAEFLQYVLSFFKKVVDAKYYNQHITADWYRQAFLNPQLSSDELIIHSGLNKKTISNMYNSARREIVLEATMEHYQKLYETINLLVEENSDTNLTLAIKFNGISVDLTMNECLIIINTLAVKRAELRGGAWSSVGKQVEKILMKVLCRLYSVPSEHYQLTGLTEAQREVDFYLIDSSSKHYQCEVKLMGQGNPESADAIIARDSDIFVADKLSDLNKKQLDGLQVKWVELRSEKGYQKFRTLLQELSIPHTDFIGDVASRVNEILEEIL